MSAPWTDKYGVTYHITTYRFGGEYDGEDCEVVATLFPDGDFGVQITDSLEPDLFSGSLRREGERVSVTGTWPDGEDFEADDTLAGQDPIEAAMGLILAGH